MTNTRSAANATTINAGGVKPAGVLCALVLAFGLVACDRSPANTADDATEETTATVEADTLTPPAGDPRELQPILQLVAGGRFDEARSALDQYRQRHPDDARAVFLYGMTYHRARDYAAAEPLFQQALAMDPSDATVHHFLGWARFHQGDLGGARASFVAHLEAVPGEADSVFGLGLVEMQEGNFAEAEALFLESMELIRALAGTDPQAFMRRSADLGKCKARIGEMAFEQGDYEKARGLFENAIHDDPNQYTAYNFLAQIYRRLGDEEKAAQYEAKYEATVEARGRS